MKVVKQTTKKLVQDETFMVMPSLSNCFDEFAQLTLPKPSDARNIVQLQEELEELRVAMEQSHLQDQAPQTTTDAPTLDLDFDFKEYFKF